MLEDTGALPDARLTRQNGATTTIQALTATATTDAIDLEAPVAERSPAGTVSVSSRLDDGWRASVDGQNVPVRPGAFGVMSVSVPAGWRTARFSYEAPGFQIGLILAACALLACVAASAASGHPKAGGRRRQAPSSRCPSKEC
jgi:hypothetical protein